MSTKAAPVIILVEPQMGENIGMAARAMANMGLSELRIVRPRDGWPNEKARANAANAVDLVDRAAVFDSLAAAIADCHFVYATTARDHRQAKPVAGPKQAAAQSRARIAAGQRIAVLFGRERIGLLNEEVALADEILTLPVNPEFASLNLAQAVMLVGYEWLLSEADEGEMLPFVTDLGSPPATRAQVLSLFNHLEGALEAAGFFTSEQKKETMRRNLRNILHRRQLTEQDVRTLHGVVASLIRHPDARAGSDEP